MFDDTILADGAMGRGLPPVAPLAMPTQVIERARRPARGWLRRWLRARR